MPVGFADKKKTRKVRFLTGVFYEGTDYGPDYKDTEAVIDAANAHAFVAQGRAVYIDGEGDDENAPATVPPAKAKAK